MVLKEGEVLRCPKCGGKMFNATAHVTQDWVMDEYGAFQSCLNDCVEVTHEPGQDDIFGCRRCGFSGAGSKFITKSPEEKEVRLNEDRVAECVFDISLMAQHMIEERRIVVEDSRSLFNAILGWAKEFETGWAKYEIEGDYMEKIEEFAEEKLLDAYGRENELKPKVLTVSPTVVARQMIEDLGNGDSENGDRWSSYFELARGVGGDFKGRVVAALGEEKHNLPESEWGYCLHIINGVDETDCELYHTDHLSEDELVGLLDGLMEKMKKGEL